ncbi:hypothetical protein B9Z45_16675, partial [Limnohabitans sp. 2KL-17]|uniref:hypothetical protein n=1 Tax=Limnohabitans sp. 2KL-17 TaxID=1100704 RepID=UPI000DD1BB10
FVAAAQVLVNSDIKVSANSVNAAQLPTITNLLTNGSFTTSTPGEAAPTGWTVGGTNRIYSGARGADGDGGVSMGFGTGFNDISARSFITQTISTEIGKSYTFQVEAYGWSSGQDSAVTLSAYDGASAAGTATVSENFVCGPDQASETHNNQGRTYSITFTAQSTSTTVRILDSTAALSVGEDLIVDRAIVFETATGYISGSTGATDTSINDTLFGTSANDKMAGGTGNDTINGQGGTNTALYTGSRSQYTITIASG